MIISLLNEYQSKTRIAHYLNEKLAGDHKLGLIKHIMSIWTQLNLYAIANI